MDLNIHGRLERLKQSKDILNHLLNHAQYRISPQDILKQVLEFGEILKSN